MAERDLKSEFFADTVPEAGVEFDLRVRRSVIFLVSLGKMGEHALYDQPRGAQRLTDKRETLVIRPYPDPAHSRVKSYMNTDFLSLFFRCRGKLFQHILPEAGRPDLETGQFPVAIGENIAEKYDRLLRAILSQFLCFLKGRRGISPYIGELLHLLHDRDRAVPVSVRLEHRDDLHIFPDVRPHALHIKEHSVHIDLGPHSVISG